MQPRNPTEQALYDLLNPRGPAKAILSLQEDRESARDKHRLNAWHFLTTGESILPSPDGREWDRNYNPIPYPEARPVDPDFYMGTGIGLLYNIEGCLRHAWQLAGWNIVRTGAEVRARRK